MIVWHGVDPVEADAGLGGGVSDEILRAGSGRPLPGLLLHEHRSLSWRERRDPGGAGRFGADGQIGHAGRHDPDRRLERGRFAAGECSDAGEHGEERFALTLKTDHRVRVESAIDEDRQSRRLADPPGPRPQPDAAPRRRDGCGEICRGGRACPTDEPRGQRPEHTRGYRDQPEGTGPRPGMGRRERTSCSSLCLIAGRYGQ